MLPKPCEGALLELYGSWQDERKADQIIDQIKKARKNTKKSEAAF